MFGVEAIFALILWFYAEYDDKFGGGIFKVAINRYMCVTIFYTFLLFIFGTIYGQSQIYYRYPLRHFISRNTWQDFIKFSLIYYPIVYSYPIKIILNDVYRISKQYGNIVPPESIQIMQTIFFSIFVSGFLLMNISSKVEEFLMNLYDHDFYNNPKEVNNYRKKSKD